jgi:hypothetical protein
MPLPFYLRADQRFGTFTPLPFPSVLATRFFHSLRPQCRHRFCRSRARKLDVAMSNWSCSIVTRSMLCRLVEAG